MDIALPPRVGVVGCGYWGRNLVRNFHELGALAAICDLQQENLGAMRQQYGVPATDRVDELLMMRDVQAVVVAAPAALHYELAKKALLCGKDVFVEKPLALQLEQGAELVDLARARSRILMVGHLLHYHPATAALQRMLEDGELGKIEYISSSRLNFGKLRTEEDILWSFAPHDISMILHLLGEPPTTVAAQGASYLNHPISDVTLTILAFKSGVKAHIFVSWLHPFKEQKIVIVGDRKMAVFDDTSSENKLVLYPHRIEWVNRMPVARRAEGEVIALENVEPLRAECAHFLDCVEHRKRPRTDGENGLEVLRVLHAAGQSIHEQGRPISFEANVAPTFFVHPSAIVDQPCEIGSGTKVWHFSHVMKGSRIGANCNLGQNVHVASDVRIGRNVKIQNNVSVYTGVELEDDVFCGPSMVFTNVMTPRSHVNRKSEYRRTLIRKGASLGANSTIICGVTVGEYAFVGAGAVVTKDVPAHALVAGVPARRVGWVCECGVRLQPSGDILTCPGCENSYRPADGTLSKVEVAKLSDVPKPERSIAASATAS
ncbi:MAG TPA: Gfo/Idh/MocA family oxidoreductase [Verrucomicrobiae bacterium]|nr:Gfo/Idh/MocA family oxidoreductase [Verrucomicrobiae bacterium]